MFEFLWQTKKTEQPKVLVIDDEPNILQTLQDRLEMNDYEVLTATNGKEGLEKALDEQPDIILLDVIMPIMDGHEMLKELRKDERGQGISVIMLTACSQSQDVVRAKASGIDDYIIKPFNLSELLEKIENILEHKNALSEM